jgi:ribosome-associated toxin RatA of RatAB toxin-antitoxin module
VPVIEANIDIRARDEDVFDLAQDYGLRLEWDPFLSEMKFRDDASEAAVGVKVWVRAKNGLTMEVVYITLERPRSVAMKMIAGPRFFERFAGTWRFDAITADRTRVTFRYNFETRWSWLRPGVNRIIGWVLGRDVRLRLEGLKRAAEQTNILARLRPSASHARR